jgi:hypothetical protein
MERAYIYIIRILCCTISIVLGVFYMHESVIIYIFIMNQLLAQIFRPVVTRIFLYTTHILKTRLSCDHNDRSTYSVPLKIPVHL